jgi:hypothetical protein
MVSGSNSEMALAMAAYCACAGLALSRHRWPSYGHPIQHPACFSNSPAPAHPHSHTPWPTATQTPSPACSIPPVGLLLNTPSNSAVEHVLWLSGHHLPGMVYPSSLGVGLVTAAMMVLSAQSPQYNLHTSHIRILVRSNFFTGHQSSMNVESSMR